MQSSIFIRLSIMMFLQFFIWGAWYVTVGQFMSRPDISLELSIGHIYTVGPIAAIISPIFLGMIADRFFSTERVLAVLHILGGVALFFSPQLAELSATQWQETVAAWKASGVEDVAAHAREQWLITAHLPFIGIVFLHMLCYMPTLGLTNTLAFHNLTNQEKQFPLIRVFGTIGWIVAGLIVSVMLGADESALPLQIAGGAAVALGLFSFFLPHTPPPAKGTKPNLSEAMGLGAVGMMKNPSFSVFILASLLICIPLAAYYAFAQLFVNYSGFSSPAGVMTVGQMSEIVFMLLMPLFFARLGVKWMLLAGMLAWVLRYALFAMGASDGVAWMILIGIALHGICYDFFFVTGFIYTDKKSPRRIRGQAQGFLVLVTQGIGLGLGAQIMQRVLNGYKAENYDSIVAQATALREQAAGLPSAEAQPLLDQASTLLLTTYNWEGFWIFPCIFAAGVAVLFFLTFRDRAVDGEDLESTAKGAMETTDTDATEGGDREIHPSQA